ncbi:PDZ domain-containing protein [Paludisphaera mucosa]|uniref:PDZ domain-containing protein n=1 Tax=Paludisphaera mucosa TaxID=3030827 RepID=A0ABT6FH56_9BACT|nr:PDZ domain-containing protein [Paludisphaera mucosa]MDG3006875.1 PDZ domain-containing protein [Paludisphaera mucosa]
MAWSPARRSRSVLLLALATISNLNSGTASARADGRRVIQAILVVDDNSQLAGLDLDLEHVNAALSLGLGADDQLVGKVFRGREVTPRNLLLYIASLKVDPNDTLLFYYTGHGATLDDQGHMLGLMGARGPDGRPVPQTLLRSQLRDALTAKGARLTVLLSDCCANLLPAAPPQPPTPGNPAPGAPSGPTVLQMLMFEHQGLVDLTSSTYDPAARRGEASITTAETGSFFTAVLTSLIMAPTDELDVAPRDGFVEWKELFPRVREGTRDFYRGFRESRLADAAAGQPVTDPDTHRILLAQPDQTPFAFQLASRRDARAGGGVELFAANLGISYQLIPFRDHLAARLTRPAAPGSPASSVGFEPGDQIFTLDGVPIRGPEDVVGHVDRTTVDFINTRNNQLGSTVLMLPASRPAAAAPYVLGVLTVPVPLQAADGTTRYGLYVATVNPGGPAQRAGLEAGDILLTANGRPTQSHADLAGAIAGSQGRLRLTLRNVRPPNAETTLDAVLAPSSAGAAALEPAAPQ